MSGDENEATSYYLRIIKEAILLSGDDVKIVYDLRDIVQTDYVITIHAKAFFYVLLNNRKQYIINWFQGVVPEEALYMYDKSFTRYPRKLLWELFERIVLKYSQKIFFVSKAMLTHYQNKYKYNKNNYFIMPCFNQEFVIDTIMENKYLYPSFVYVGSLSKWQCIDEMLQLYGKIKLEIPNASLSILTSDKEKAFLLLEKYNLQEEVEINYIPVELLNKELQKYKYGFIIRKDNVVNKVATPTKMNSYMASGVIPVFSDVILDFKEVFSELKYVVKFTDYFECINKIKEIEYKGIDINYMREEYQTIFNTYYNKNYYLENISLFLQK